MESLPVLAPYDVSQFPLATGEKLYLLQFIGPIMPTWKDSVQTQGAQLGGYVSDNTFLSHMLPESVPIVEANAFVFRLVEMLPAYKLAPELLEETQSSENIDLAVSLFAVADRDMVAAEVTDEMGGSLLLPLSADEALPSLIITLPGTEIITLARFSQVTYLSTYSEPQFTNSNVRWIAQTDVPEQTPLYNLNLYGEGQIVAVDERGIAHLELDPVSHEPTHCQFQREDHITMLIKPGYICDPFSELCWHSTAVLSTLGGDRGEPNGGLYGRPDGFDGVVPAAHLILQGGYGETYEVAQMAYDAGARIQSNSWESVGAGSYELLARAYDQFMWDHSDFLVVFAAGNILPMDNGVTGIRNPATAKNIITVGGTENYPDQESRWLEFLGTELVRGSRPGLMIDGRVKPTIMLPAVGVNNGLRHLCDAAARAGTSFAAPAVAGSAALIRQYLAEYRSILNPSAALVKAMIVNSGRNMTGEYTSGAIPSNGQGWGRVTLNDVLRLPGESGALHLYDYVNGLNTSQSANYTLSVPAPQNWRWMALKVTLVWTDYPGEVSAARAIVNDLDLEVIAPDGTSYYGNVFAPGLPYSAPAGQRDRVNVEEQVLILHTSGPLLPGEYQIIVSAYNIPQGPQPFALVVNLSPKAEAFLSVLVRPEEGAAPLSSPTPPPYPPPSPYP